jgi:transcriptional regulator with XRE-family HTH domain
MRVAGTKVRAARRRRGWTQLQLGARVGLSQSAVSRWESGEGAAFSVLTWERAAMVLDLPLDFRLGRDALELPADAGHLAVQELVLRLGRITGRRRTFELPTKPADPARSTDVGLRDDILRCLTLIECVNTFGTINAAFRSSDRKRADAKALAAGHGQPYSVHVCWVVRATRRNREIVARYPEIFAARFTGSSRDWVRALAEGGRPPDEPGMVWCDVNATRLLEWRRPAAQVSGAGA